MYSIDTLERLNDEAVKAHYAKIEAQNDLLEDVVDTEDVPDETEIITCDWCDQPATEALVVLNPADELNGVDGAYGIIHICEDCQDNGYLFEEHFYCSECGRLFIVNHSWDVLAVTNAETGEMFCQKCALDNADHVTIRDLECSLYDGDVDDFLRLDAVPGHELLWEGGYSGYGDFSGAHSPREIADEITDIVNDLGIGMDTEVIPVITFTGQFHVNLAVYYA